MLYQSTREVYRSEDGVFIYDVWQTGTEYEVMCEQVDTSSRYKAYTSGESRKEAISKAIKECIENNES